MGLELGTHVKVGARVEVRGYTTVLSLQQEPLSKGYAIVVYAIGVWRCMAYLPWRQAKHLGLHGGNVAPVVSFGA